MIHWRPCFCHRAPGHTSRRRSTSIGFQTNLMDGTPLHPAVIDQESYDTDESRRNTGTSGWLRRIRSGQTWQRDGCVHEFWPTCAAQRAHIGYRGRPDPRLAESLKPGQTEKLRSLYDSKTRHPVGGVVQSPRVAVQWCQYELAGCVRERCRGSELRVGRLPEGLLSDSALRSTSQRPG
jgi:hypothetical protein